MTQEQSPQHPQLTPEQVQLWESDPVTKTYLRCLDEYIDDVRDDASNGAVVDSSRADLTHAMIHRNLGQQQGLTTALGYMSLFYRHDAILMPKEEDDAED